MKPSRGATLSAVAAAVAAALVASGDARAVSPNADGLGQALIFPYYTVQSAGGNAFNTYISVVNHRSEAKALRVRFREGRASREVLSFNLFLSPNDVWTGAVVPSGAGARLVSTDVSCTDPVFSAEQGLEFRNAAYSGTLADGFGDGLDRTREGFLEILEMSTLTGATADAVTHRASGAPAGCALAGGANPVDVVRPMGGLSGTLTLINVNSGLDFTVNAEALADLASRPYYRAATDAYPDFDASEIDPVSVVVANGQMYRSVWANPVSAVSAVLMRSAWLTEFVLDRGTASLTDVVLTLPTRHLHTTASVASPPFSSPARWAAGCEGLSAGPLRPLEIFGPVSFNREASNPYAILFPPTDPPPPAICAAAAVGSIRNLAPHMPSASASASAVLGSTNRGLWPGRNPVLYENGWMQFVAGNTISFPLVSLPASTRIDLATGQQTTGSHRYVGLPSLGFTVRTFRNGTLACTGGTCQGNYGGAFPLKYQRSITSP